MSGSAVSVSQARIIARDPGYAFVFDGAASYIGAAFTVANTTTSPITICGRIKMTGTPTNSADSMPIIYTKYHYMHVRLTNGVDYALNFRMDNGGARQASWVIRQNIWYDFVAVYEPSGANGNQKLYINGLLVNEQPNSSVQASNTYTEQIGKSTTPTYFQGYMKDIVVFNAALTITEAMKYHVGVDPRSIRSGLTPLFYYSGDDQNVSNATDYSGNGNNGTLNSMSYAASKLPVGVRTAAGTRQNIVSSVSATDTFTRADSDTTLGATETGSLTWERPPLGSAVFGIASNKAKYVSGSGIIVVEASTPDVDVSVTMDTYAGANEMALYFRCQDGNNYFRMIRSGTSLLLQRRLASVTTTLINLSGQTFANGDVFRVWCRGPLIIGYLNGVEKFRLRDSNLFTVTTHGLGTGTTNTGYRWDNFTLTSTRSEQRVGV